MTPTLDLAIQHKRTRHRINPARKGIDNVLGPQCALALETFGERVLQMSDGVINRLVSVQHLAT